MILFKCTNIKKTRNRYTLIQYTPLRCTTFIGFKATYKTTLALLYSVNDYTMIYSATDKQVTVEAVCNRLER